MEFKQLIFFKKVAEWEHVTKAAQELDTSQPFLSKTISDLEEELGVALFDHKGRNISLNEYGKIFYQKVCCSLQEIEDGKREIQDLHATMDMQIRIASNGSMFLPEIVSGFQKKYPLAHILQISRSIEQMAKMLKSNEVDFIVSSPALKEDGEFKSQVLLRDKLCIIYPRNHWLSKRNSVMLSELKEELFIVSTPGFAIRNKSDTLFKEAGFKPNYIIQSTDTYNIPSYVEKGLGIAFLPQFFLKSNSSLQYQSIEVTSPNCEVELNLTWKKNGYFNYMYQIFYDFITEYFKLKKREDPRIRRASHTLFARKA